MLSRCLPTKKEQGEDAGGRARTPVEREKVQAERELEPVGLARTLAGGVQMQVDRARTLEVRAQTLGGRG
jgi:hypothetical protein